MKKIAKKVCVTLTLVLMLLQFSAIAPSYNAIAASSYIDSYVTASADIRPSPYAFTPITDTIQNQAITIIERDGLFFYIEYQKSNETTVRRGYIAYEDVNYDKSLISWCNHTEYNPGHISSNSNVYVYFGPDNRNTNYMWSSTLAPDVGGDTDSKPLLVLRQEGQRYFVQFVLNPTQLSNDVQPFYVRGWVPVSSVAVDKPQLTSYFGGDSGSSYVTLIKNVSNSTSGGLYLTARYNESTNKYYTVLEEPTGYQEQRWRVYPFTASNGAVYYKIKSEKYDLYLHVEDGLPMAGADITLRELSDPNKAQEFWLQEFTGGKESLIDCDDTSILPEYKYNGYVVGYVYRVRTRVTGGYQAMSIDGVTGVCESRVAATWKDVWSFERLDKYWSGGYNNLAKIDGVRQFDYYIYDNNTDKDVDEAGISKNQIIESISRWNNIYSDEIGVQIHAINTSSAVDNTISIYARNLGTAAQARTYHCIIMNNDDGEEEQVGIAGSTYIDIPWYRAEIVLNSNTGTTGFDAISGINAKKGAVCHEFGHALKLSHPYGEIDANYAEQVVYSVMNQGIYTNEDDPLNANKLKVKYYPTDYDKQTLLNKWENE